jgi:rubrerythrin
MEKEKVSNDSPLIRGINGPVGRRKFFFYGATALTTAAILSSCKKDDPAPTPTPTPTPTPNADTVDLGTGDIGILNYAYALEQLEAAFYLQVALTPFSGITAAETAILNDIRDHEVIHRDFFKAALGDKAIRGLNVDFSKINFSDRTSVLNTAMAFEDLGVAAYNGAGKLIKTADYLVLAGKIVSVEARHASAIRDLLKPKTTYFAGDDIVTIDTGFDRALMPSDVLAAAQNYVKTTITFGNLPK